MKIKTISVLIAAALSFNAIADQIYFKVGAFPSDFNESTPSEGDNPSEPEIPQEDLSDGRLPGTLAIGKTCAEILNSSKSKGDGDYTVLITGEKKAVYCDMTTNSGGWMLLNDYGSDAPHKNALGKVGINTFSDLVSTLSMTQMLLGFNGGTQQGAPTPGSIWNRPDSVSFNNPDGRGTANLRLPGYGTALRIDAPRVGATNRWDIKITNPVTKYYSVDGSFGGTQVMTYWTLGANTVVYIEEELGGVIQLDKTWIR